MANHYEWMLRQEITSRSVANTWDRAKLEWELTWIEESFDPERCLCTKFPIKELCYLANTRNGARVVVGNICVKKFLRIPSGKLFAALKRVKKDLNKPLNPELIEHCYNRKVFGKRDREFYLDTWRKRELTPKQAKYRRFLNYQAVNAICKEHDLTKPAKPAT